MSGLRTPPGVLNPREYLRAEFAADAIASHCHARVGASLPLPSKPGTVVANSSYFSFITWLKTVTVVTPVTLPGPSVAPQKTYVFQRPHGGIEGSQPFQGSRLRCTSRPLSSSDERTSTRIGRPARRLPRSADADLVHLHPLHLRPSCSKRFLPRVEPVWAR